MRLLPRLRQAQQLDKVWPVSVCVMKQSHDHELRRVLLLHQPGWLETSAGRLYEAVSEALTAGEQRKLLQCVEHSELEYWRALLSYPPAAEIVLSTVERRLSLPAPAEISHVRKLARTMCKTEQQREEWVSVTALLATFVQGIDLDRVLVREADRAVQRLAGMYRADGVQRPDDALIIKRFSEYLGQVKAARTAIPQAIAALLPIGLYKSEEHFPHALVQAVGSLTAELMAYLKTHPNELHALRPRQFEELIAEVLASYGWTVELTPESKDGGYDIYAVSSERAGISSAWVIECKKYDPRRRVGVEIVRGLYGTQPVQNGANALVATTSSFTKGAREYKATRLNLELRGVEGVLDWINSYHPLPGGALYLKDSSIHQKARK